jgi:hypothetical protein
MSVESIQATIKTVTRDRVLSGADSAAIIKSAKKNIKPDEINALAKFYVELKHSRFVLAVGDDGGGLFGAAGGGVVV